MFNIVTEEVHYIRTITAEHEFWPFIKIIFFVKKTKKKVFLASPFICIFYIYHTC